jgi:hypothetical protein
VERSGGQGRRRHGRLAAALAGLIALLAEPGAATPIGGALSSQGESIPEILRAFLESRFALAPRGRFGPRDLPLGEEGLRITSLLLPGEDSPALDSRRFHSHFHRRATGAWGFVPAGTGGSPGTTAIPEPTTLALLASGLAAAALARRRPGRR